MLILKQELDLQDFEREFRDELKNLSFEAVEMVFYALCGMMAEGDSTVTGVRDYLRYQMQVMSLKEVIDSYGYNMELQDLEEDELIETVEEYLNYNTYLFGIYEQDGETFFIFDEF